MINAIHGRRSIRNGFRESSIPDHVVTEILRCGCMAPSSKDEQHWRLHAVRDQAVLAMVANAMVTNDRTTEYVPLDPATGAPRAGYASSVVESADIVRDVALGVFVENDGSFSGGRSAIARAREDILDEILVGYTFELVGIGAAIQNMWLAAHDLGLAGVFVGDVVIAEACVREQLGMAGDLLGVLALGFSEAEPHAAKEIKEGRVVIHPLGG